MDKAAAISFLVGLVVASQEVAEYQQDTGTVKIVPSEWSKPSFCHRLDCPKYSVLNKFDNFEERKYEASTWVTTAMSGMDLEEATRPMFWKLFKYIGGENERGEKIAMTAPVRMRIIPGQGPACESNFTMSFFVSPKVGVPPKATDKSVFIEELPSETFYVISFPGFANTYEVWKKHALELAADLEKKKLSNFETDYYYTNGYDSPFKLLNRHNEIWFKEIPPKQISPSKPIV